MKSNVLFVIASCVLLSTLALGEAWPRQQNSQTEQLPRNVTITAIPEVIAARAQWQQVWQGTTNADGIVATADGGLLFAQEQPSTIRKLDVNDYDYAYAKDTHGAGTAVIDSQGRVVAAQRTCTDPGRGDLPCSEPTMVSIVYPESERRVLVDNYQGESFGRISGAIVDTQGTVYVDSGGAYYVKPGGEAVKIGNDIRPSGIMLSPDETIFYVGSGDKVVAFDLQPDGTFGGEARDFGMLAPGTRGNGMAVDALGRLYVASGATGIQVLSPEGDHLGIIPTPRNVVDVAFAGPNKRLLYTVGSGALAPNGREFTLAEGFRNNSKTIYKIPMLAQGYLGRPR